MKTTHTGTLTLSPESISKIRDGKDNYSEVIISMNGEKLPFFIEVDENLNDIAHFTTKCGHEAKLGLKHFSNVKDDNHPHGLISRQKIEQYLTSEHSENWEIIYSPDLKGGSNHCSTKFPDGSMILYRVIPEKRQTVWNDYYKAQELHYEDVIDTNSYLLSQIKGLARSY